MYFGSPAGMLVPGNGVAVPVLVSVCVGVLVTIGVCVRVAVSVAVGVGVFVGVGVLVAVGRGVLVGVGVAVVEYLTHTCLLPTGTSINVYSRPLIVFVVIAVDTLLTFTSNTAPLLDVAGIISVNLELLREIGGVACNMSNSRIAVLVSQLIFCIRVAARVSTNSNHWPAVQVGIPFA